MLLDREAPPKAREHDGLIVHADAHRWSLDATAATGAARARREFRSYLELYGDAKSDFHAAEAVFGELVGNCVVHAPKDIRVEFRWHDRTLMVVEGEDRLRHWPFSPADMRAESTHHAFALIQALTERIHLARDGSGGTRASVVLPVKRARNVPVVRSEG